MHLGPKYKDKALRDNLGMRYILSFCEVVDRGGQLTTYLAKQDQPIPLSFTCNFNRAPPPPPRTGLGTYRITSHALLMRDYAMQRPVSAAG